MLKAVKEAVDLLGGIDRFIQPGQRVLLKPNLLSARPPDHAVCTHPAVAEAVAGLAMAAGGVCSLGDGSSTGASSVEAFSNLLSVTGMKDVVDRTGIAAIPFNLAGTEREVPDAKVFKRLYLADALEDTDVLINIPKFKTHELTLFTGAVKNLYGCISGRKKIEFHLQAGDNPEMFAQILVDILRKVRPQLSIMDGIVGMDGQGPAAGRRRTFGVIIAGADPVSVDAVACMVAGVDPFAIPMLRLASEQGVGVANPSEIEIVGLQPADVRIPDFLLPQHGDIIGRMPKRFYHMLRNHLVSRPSFLRDKCTDCGTCTDICPVHAISGQGSDLRVDLSECIRCYCCQEVCPQEAICLRTSRFAAVLEGAMAARRGIRGMIKREGSSSKRV